MHQNLFRRSARQSALLPAVLVAMAVAVSAAAHALAAAGAPQGAMNWGMAVMAVLCLSCALPMVVGQRCSRRAAGHLMTMSAAMILFHLFLLTSAGTTVHSGHALGSLAVPVADNSATDHGGAMLALMGVELLSLGAASAAMRFSRRTTAKRPDSFGGPACLAATEPV